MTNQDNLNLLKCSVQKFNQFRAEHPNADFYFSDANLEGANLRLANLQHRTHLDGANLEGADLRSAELMGTNLKGANLRGADLTDAKLMGANLSGADFTGAKLYNTKFEGAQIDAHTVMSDEQRKYFNEHGGVYDDTPATPQSDASAVKALPDGIVEVEDLEPGYSQFKVGRT